MNVENLELGDLVNSGNCAATDVLLMKLGIINPQLTISQATIEMPQRKQGTSQATQSTHNQDDQGIYKIDNYRQKQRQTPQNRRVSNLQPVV